jgi:transposase-like protein
MKYSNEIIQEIIGLKRLGVKSRQIAEMLSISKSGVNEAYNRYLEEVTERVASSVSVIKKPRVLLFDLETAPAVALAFGRRDQNLGDVNIVSEGGWILCASWKWDDSPEIYSSYLNSDEVYLNDDSRIVNELFDLFTQADAVVAHNLSGFDKKVLQTRCIANGLGALPVVKDIDTLQIARRKLKLPSNRLDSIAKYFDLEMKLGTGGMQLWKEVLECNEESMQKMVKYCEQDVTVLSQVFDKLKSLGLRPFNAALYYDDGEHHCPNCGSVDVHPTGRVVSTSLSQFAEYRCESCGGTHRTRTNLVSKEKSKQMVLPL